MDEWEVKTEIGVLALLTTSNHDCGLNHFGRPGFLHKAEESQTYRSQSPC